MRPLPRRAALAAAWLLCSSSPGAFAQGVTGGAIAGTVADLHGRPAAGVDVLAVHGPSRSRYAAVSRGDGRYTIPDLRVGGPYTVTASLVGFEPAAVRGVVVALGTTTELLLSLGRLVAADEVTVTAGASSVWSPARTGAATTVPREALASLPRVRDRLDEFSRLTPQYFGGAIGGAFAGTDRRLVGLTVDGSSFNTFMGGQPGDRTNVAPIPTEAIEEIQVGVAPYDVRQANFVGAGLNAVTRGGGNTIRGSAYYWRRDDGLAGREAKGLRVDPGPFEFDKWGGWVSGPLVRGRLFYFAAYEKEDDIRAGTTYRANRGGETVEGNVTRVLGSDLDALGRYLRESFGYDPGPYEDYLHRTPATRYLARLDWDVSDRSKLRLRYNQLDSATDLLASNAPSLGAGLRNGSTSALNFDGSNYRIREDIRSLVGEWSAVLGASASNSLILGYTSQDESRSLRGALFPAVDIREGGLTYTTLGAEPFTPGNELRYRTLQLQDTLTWNRGRHAFAVGASVERFVSENVFFPGSQGVYVYGSLADFYADAEDHRRNPERTTSPVTLSRFQVRWLNVPGLSKPVQPLEVWYAGVFGQDEWRVSPRLTLTGGLRLDVPSFGDTGYRNPEADGLTFRDEDGEAVRYDTKALPSGNVLWSPRVGFNWDVDGRRRTQLRGGTGVFTGRPVWTWISSQLAGSGVLMGFEQLDNTRARPFHPSPDAHEPEVVTGAPPRSYELTLTDPGFRFPQVWRSDLAIDHRLPWGLTGTVEALLTRELNGVGYINANLPAPQSRLQDADGRARWTANRIHPQVTSAVVLGNQDEGRGWSVAASLAKSYRSGFLRAAYAYGESRSPVEPGALAPNWATNPHAGDPNNPGPQYFSRGHRAFVAGTHRFEYARLATTVSFFFEGRNAGTGSYTYAGDLNGDGGAVNDLVYVPRDESEMGFQPFVSGGRAFTAAEQAAAWNTFIAQDPHLRRRRGGYAERNGVLLPMVWRLDLAVAQQVLARRGARRHAVELRADVLNATNLLDDGWGVARRLTSPQPLTNARVDAQGRAAYQMRVVDGQLLSESFQPSATVLDVYRVQLSLRYSFD